MEKVLRSDHVVTMAAMMKTGSPVRFAGLASSKAVDIYVELLLQKRKTRSTQ